MSNGRSPQNGRYASPPCHAEEADPADIDIDRDAVEPQQEVDVARWRSAERKRLRAERAALSVEERRDIANALAHHLDMLIAERGVAGQVVSGYWPIKGEPDLRAWLKARHGAGAVTALPSVETKAAPLVFRAWSPETKMVRGDWNIPVPPPDAPPVTPEIALAPLVGWDAAGYRLGYGGGYFDRTLASLSRAPSRSASGSRRRKSRPSTHSRTTSVSMRS